MPNPARSFYERWSDRLTDWCPYVTLARGVGPDPPWSTETPGERLVTAGLVALAAVWVYVGYTRTPKPRQAHRARMLVYFIGLLTIATLLSLREYLFFIFLITGFFHAMMLRPWVLLIGGVFATSVLVNTVIGGFPTNPEWLAIWVAIIVIQTLAIGGGGILGERMAEVSEQRRLAVARLEAALEENAGLHAQLLTQAREAGVLDERQRMAGEIHDTIAQGLTGIVTQLEAAEQARDRPEAWQRHVRNAIASRARACPRRGDRSRARGLSTSRPRACPRPWPTSPGDWSALNGVPVEVMSTGDVHAAAPRGRGGAAANRAGGAGQRRQARQRHARRADAVLHGRRRDARRARRRRRLRGLDARPASAGPASG